jgi:hypothetical protein
MKNICVVLALVLGVYSYIEFELKRTPATSKLILSKSECQDPKSISN